MQIADVQLEEKGSKNSSETAQLINTTPIETTISSPTYQNRPLSPISIAPASPMSVPENEALLADRAQSPDQQFNARQRRFEGWSMLCIGGLFLALLTAGFFLFSSKPTHTPPVFPDAYTALHNIVTGNDRGRIWYSWPLRAFKAEVFSSCFDVPYRLRAAHQFVAYELRGHRADAQQ